MIHLDCIYPSKINSLLHRLQLGYDPNMLNSKQETPLLMLFTYELHR